MSEFDKIMATQLVSIGNAGITVHAVISAAVVVVVAIGLIWVTQKLTVRAQSRLGEGRASTMYVLGQIARYGIVVAAIFAVISTLGVDLSALSLFAGALGVGIGLGLQDVVKNFVYGIILLFDGTIEVGDYIELNDGTAGSVSAIGPRATTLRTNDHIDILVPNSVLLADKLTNWTRERASRRMRIPFTVAYGSDKEIVKLAAIEAAQSVPFTLPDEGPRKTQVWLTGFGDSALEFALIVWPTLDAVKRPGSMRAGYYWALDDALARHGIEIPFNQLDVRMRSYYGQEGQAAIEAATAVTGKRREGKAAARKAVAKTANDAADDVANDEVPDAV